MAGVSFVLVSRVFDKFVSSIVLFKSNIEKFGFDCCLGVCGSLNFAILIEFRMNYLNYFELNFSVKYISVIFIIDQSLKLLSFLFLVSNSNYLKYRYSSNYDRDMFLSIGHKSKKINQFYINKNFHF